jgi:hypothetical protein
MKNKKEARQNPELLKEFKVTRYLWEFSEKWLRAHKVNGVEKFWGEVEGTLIEFDEKNPTARRALPLAEVSIPALKPNAQKASSPPPRSRTPPSLPQASVSPKEHPPTPKVLPAAPSGEQMPKPSAPLPKPSAPLPKLPAPLPKQPLPLPKPPAPLPKTVTSLPKTVGIPLPKPAPLPKQNRGPLPKPATIQTTNRPATPPSKPRAPAFRRRPATPPLAGPSKPRATVFRPPTITPEAGPSGQRNDEPSDSQYTESQHSSPGPSYNPTRITPAPSKTKRRAPEIEISESDVSHSSDEYVNEKKDKGKGKRKEVKPTEEVVVAKKVRKPPEPTGVVRNPPCGRCVDKKITCFKQRGGLACMDCATAKLKCIDFHGEERPGKKLRKKKEAIKQASAVKPEPLGTQAKHRALNKPREVQKAGPKNAEDLSASDTGHREASPVPRRRKISGRVASDAKRRVVSGKAEGKRPERSEACGFGVLDESAAESSSGESSPIAKRRKISGRVSPDPKRRIVSGNAKGKRPERSEGRGFGILERGKSKSNIKYNIYFHIIHR